MAFESLAGVPYSEDTSLNTLDLCIIDESNLSKKPWVIYIHGGAWRDPLISSSSFNKTQSLLLSSQVIHDIAGLASINYRLSPHPDHPSKDPSRLASHPDHIDDVLSALSYLQAQYRIGCNYILVGHSCGATLAFQVAMSRGWTASGPHIGDAETKILHAPMAIVGLEGIYNIPALVEYHKEQPIYRDFIKGAFGERLHENVDVWTEASPTNGRYDEQTWKEGRYVLLAHSREDELVEWQQVVLMKEALQSRGWSEQTADRGKGRVFEVMEIAGNHDEVWEKGAEVVRTIRRAIEHLKPS